MEGVLPQWRSTEAEGTQDGVPHPIVGKSGECSIEDFGAWVQILGLPPAGSRPWASYVSAGACVCSGLEYRCHLAGSVWESHSPILARGNRWGPCW